MKTAQKSKIDLSSILLNASFLLFSTLIITIITIIETSPAHAESSSASANASVTVSDTIRLTLTGGDLVINDLTPGTSADSNIITATVTSNSSYGFHLSATTGIKNGTTSLVNTADSNFVFTNLDSNKASLSNFSDNTWGYSYSTNDGTSWVSGDYGIAQSGYNGLSLDNDDSGATGTTLFNSDTYTNSTAVKFKIGAKSSSTQASGTYTGTVNFYAVANPGTAQCNNSALCINFDGNGLTFNGETTNNVSYVSAPIVDEQIKYSRSVYTEEGNYNGYAAQGGNDVVTIKGATSLHIKVTYGIPQGASNGPPSYLYIWEGNHPDYTNSNSNTALSQCGNISADFYSAGSAGSQQTMECDIPGDSVTFYDYSVYNVSTGYYAIVSASVDTFSRQNISGAYAAPRGNDAVFLGWSTSRTTPGEGSKSEVEYANEPEILYLMTGENAETKTLYAVWERPRSIANSLTMQEVNECPNSLPTEQIYTLTDTRDGQEYKVAKLKDGKCWMVENLNLAGGTALSADDTDVTSEYIANYIAGDSRLTKSGDTLILPTSDTSGFNVANDSYINNSGNKKNCGGYGQRTTCYSYYSWDAATLGSGRSIDADNTDATQSICPKGWKLPTSRSTSVSNWQTTSDFYQLAHQYGLDSTTSTSEDDNDFYAQAGPGTTPNFLFAGYYNNNLFIAGGSYYWSSTSYTRFDSYHLVFRQDSVSTATGSNRAYGRSVRCLFGN